MTITLFVEPKSLAIFLEVTNILKGLDVENNYIFTPSDLIFSEGMISNWFWINMEIEEYLKLKHCIGKLSSYHRLRMIPLPVRLCDKNDSSFAER
jgi:hypothetical protein